MAQDDLFALDTVAHFLEGVYNVVDVAVSFLYTHGLIFWRKECAFRNQNLGLENAVVVQQAFSQAVSHEADQGLVNFAGDFHLVFAEGDQLGRGFLQEFFLQLFFVMVYGAAHSRYGMLYFKGFQGQVLTVLQELQFVWGHGDNGGQTEFVFGDPFEQGFGTDPVLGPFRDVFGNVIDAIPFYTHHLAQAVMTHQAASMVAMGVSQKYMIDGGGRQGAFAQINAEIQFGHLQVGGQPRNRETRHRSGRCFYMNLLQGIMDVFIFCSH